MDLVTVVAHELGHALGLEHEDSGLMASLLAPGIGLSPAGLIRPERRQTIRAGGFGTIRGNKMTSRRIMTYKKVVFGRIGLYFRR